MSIDRTDSVVTEWFARPVLHVSSVEASLRFYVDRLGFTVPWRAGTDGHVDVAQVDRQGCALILSEHWPEKVGKGLMFISLNVDAATHEAEVAAVDALRAEFEARDVPVKEGHWGYRMGMRLRGRWHFQCTRERESGYRHHHIPDSDIEVAAEGEVEGNEKKPGTGHVRAGARRGGKNRDADRNLDHAYDSHERGNRQRQYARGERAHVSAPVSEDVEELV